MNFPNHVTTIFLDDGGVMNDNELRAPQWRRLVGEFFVPRLGGTRAGWAEANAVVMDGLWDQIMAGPPEGQAVVEWWDEHQVRWLRGMAKSAGVGAPQSDEECVMLAREASDYVIRNVKSDFPGAADAIKRLKQHGFELYTASGTISWELRAYLDGMEVTPLFNRIYGPDLIDQTKTHADYYRRIFEDSGVDPGEAVVLDDSVKNLDWAACTGAATVLVCSGLSAANSSSHRVITSLAELPDALVRRDA